MMFFLSSAPKMSKIYTVILASASLVYAISVMGQTNFDALSQSIELKCNQNLFDFIAASMELEVAQICLEHNACYTTQELEQHLYTDRETTLNDLKRDCKTVGAWNATLTTLHSWVETLRTKSETLGRLVPNHTKDLDCDTNGDNIAKVMDKFLDVARFMICAWQDLCFSSEEYQAHLAGEKENIIKEFREKGCRKMKDMQKEQERLFMTWLGHISKEAQALNKLPQPTKEDFEEVKQPGLDAEDTDGEEENHQDGANVDYDYEDIDAGDAGDASLEDIDKLLQQLSMDLDSLDMANDTIPLTDSNEPLEVLLAKKDDMDKLEEAVNKLSSDRDFFDLEEKFDIPSTEETNDEKESDEPEHQQQIDQEDEIFGGNDYRVPEAFNMVDDFNFGAPPTQRSTEFDLHQPFDDSNQDQREEL